MKPEFSIEGIKDHVISVHLTDESGTIDDVAAVVLKVNRKILKINFYLVDYKAKDAFNTFYVI
ncbi:hypothetical protein [Wolbachia endosymbiont (group B) of Pandemis cinnamomeana]|uniref:hypothetical protein n=1 Tax=Wolbachia endosymbiont (group B) of Pandemis cinnamomeana TaxID=2954038 RepID=UPI00248B1A0F|nr:hypothetical protein [Wolbachia endosymbiont (group B) of Pandemis cinnamomeana]